MKKTKVLIGDAGVTFSNAVSAQPLRPFHRADQISQVSPFPVVFSSLPPLCAVPVVAASSAANIHTIIWSEITPSLATAAA